MEFKINANHKKLQKGRGEWRKLVVLNDNNNCLMSIDMEIRRVITSELERRNAGPLRRSDVRKLSRSSSRSLSLGFRIFSML